MKSIFDRVSVRNFKEKEVEETKIERLLRAAMAAPSAGNQQPWEFYVVRDREVLEKLSGCSAYSGCIKKAPVAIVVCGRKEAFMPEYVAYDLCAATENILLEAVELGLGSVWLGMAPIKERMENVRQALDLPIELDAFAVLPLGYPANETRQMARFDKKRVHQV